MINSAGRKRTCEQREAEEVREEWQKGGRRGEKERVCVLSGSDLCEALERSDTFPYCSTVISG